MKVLFSVLFLLTVFTVSGSACTCVFRTHERDFREADAVFIGRVLDIGANDSGDEETRRFAPFTITLAIEKSWKGKRGQITIVSDNGGPACGGFKFEKGEEYLVYAFGRELETGTACTRSRPIKRRDDDRQKELAELGSLWFRFRSKVWRF